MTAQTLALVPRYPDGVNRLDPALSEEVTRLLQRLPVTVAISTWIMAVAHWLNACAIDDFIRYQDRNPRLTELVIGPEITETIAWRQAVIINLIYW